MDGGKIRWRLLRSKMLPAVETASNGIQLLHLLPLTHCLELHLASGLLVGVGL
jgi:hypothetical protein